MQQLLAPARCCKYRSGRFKQFHDCLDYLIVAGAMRREPTELRRHPSVALGSSRLVGIRYVGIDGDISARMCLSHSYPAPSVYSVVSLAAVFSRFARRAPKKTRATHG